MANAGATSTQGGGSALAIEFNKSRRDTIHADIINLSAEFLHMVTPFKKYLIQVFQ
jgi:hypothetical protein